VLLDRNKLAHDLAFYSDEVTAITHAFNPHFSQDFYCGVFMLVCAAALRNPVRNAG